MKFKNLRNDNEGIALAIGFNLAVANLEYFYNHIHGKKNVDISKIISANRTHNANEKLADFIWHEAKFKLFYKTPEKTLQNNLTIIIKRLNNLRNYYSHFCHSDEVLKIGKDEVDLITKLFNNALAFEKDYSEEIILFENNSFTKEGVIWFVALFLYKFQAQQLFPHISGFKKNTGLYKSKHKLYSFYCSDFKNTNVKNDDPDFEHFLQIIQYLNRNPFANENEDNFRKTNMFIHFVVKFFDDFNVFPEIEFLKKERYNNLNEDDTKNEISENNVYQYLINRNNIFFEWNIDNFNYKIEDNNQTKKLKGIIGYQTLVYLVYAAFLKPNYSIISDEVKKFYTTYNKLLEDINNFNNYLKDIEYVGEQNLPKVIRAKIEDTNDKVTLKQKVLNRIEFILFQLNNNQNGLNRNGKPLRPYDKIAIVTDYINSELTDSQKNENIKKSKTKFNAVKYKEIMSYIRYYKRDKETLIKILKNERWKFKSKIIKLLEDNSSLEELFLSVTDLTRGKYTDLKKEVENNKTNISEFAKVLNVKKTKERKIDNSYLTGIKSNGIALPAEFIKRKLLKINKNIFNYILEDEKLKKTIPLNEHFYSLKENSRKLNEKRTEERRIKIEDKLLSRIAMEYLLESNRFQEIQNILPKGVNNLTQKKYLISLNIKSKIYKIEIKSKSYHLIKRIYKNKLLENILETLPSDISKISFNELNYMEQKYNKDRYEFLKDIFNFEKNIISKNKSEINTMKKKFTQNHIGEKKYFYLSFNKIIELAEKIKIELKNAEEIKELRNAALHNFVSKVSKSKIEDEWNRILKQGNNRVDNKKVNIFFSKLDYYNSKE